ncbi:hypothetical protein [Psychrobacter aestuarii]|uniref:DUF4377 domain-containing protein n=1 Tax=Psychrobacter aestuarii TaxID=556327 RepID=A0ABN0VMW6_9GAMM|nr:hypothetical protein [Psychrobacter aestuarii]
MGTSIGLSGCQLLSGYQTIEQKPTKTWAVDVPSTAGEVSLTCAGTYHCEFTQIDKTLVVSTDTHVPMATIEAPRSDAGSNMSTLSSPYAVKATLASASGLPPLNNYYVRMLPKKREVHVNFYPEPNLNYTERFAMIHEFTQPGVYQLKAYRQATKASSGSLLDSASPEPLCIDLVHQNQVLRHFCQDMHPEHQGEFIETRVHALDQLHEHTHS